MFADLTAQQSKYSNRAMRQDFPKFILRNAYRTLINDESAASSAAEAQLDERVARAIFDVNDPEIILDLRRQNGQVTGSHFDVFWTELQSYLDEISLAVDERRHGDVLHMPFATSLRHLRELISPPSTMFGMDSATILAIQPIYYESTEVHRQV